MNVTNPPVWMKFCPLTFFFAPFTPWSSGKLLAFCFPLSHLIWRLLFACCRHSMTGSATGSGAAAKVSDNILYTKRVPRPVSQTFCRLPFDVISVLLFLYYGSCTGCCVKGTPIFFRQSQSQAFLRLFGSSLCPSVIPSKRNIEIGSHAWSETAIRQQHPHLGSK